MPPNLKEGVSTQKKNAHAKQLVLILKTSKMGECKEKLTRNNNVGDTKGRKTAVDQGPGSERTTQANSKQERLCAAQKGLREGLVTRPKTDI